MIAHAMPRTLKHSHSSTGAPRLDVYLYDKRVGALGQDDLQNVWFQYDDWVLDAQDPEMWAISVRLPVRLQPYGHRDTLAFFDNLLFEADLRDELAHITRHDRRDVPGLLGAVGGECSGAVALWPVGVMPPVLPEYRSYSDADLDAVFSEAHGERLTSARLESRQMLSGVQQKLVFLKQDGRYALPLGGSPSNVILKRPSGRYAGLVANEIVCERAFRALGLATPISRAVYGHDLFESERYDRVFDMSGALARWHQEDFCQVTGRLPQRKYQQDNGPSFRDCANVIRRYSTQSARDLADFLTATVGNLCLGNADAHAKNFALLTTPAGRRLAPFYDVVCTEVYPQLSTELSMYIGAAKHAAAVKPADLNRFAIMMGVTLTLVTNTIDMVTTTLRDKMTGLLHEVARETRDDPILGEIEIFVQRRIEKLRGSTLG